MQNLKRVFVGVVILFASCHSINREKSPNLKAKQNVDIEKGPKFKNKMVSGKPIPISAITESEQVIEKGPMFKNRRKIKIDRNAVKAPAKRTIKGPMYKNKDWVK